MYADVRMAVRQVGDMPDAHTHLEPMLTIHGPSVHDVPCPGKEVVAILVEAHLQRGGEFEGSEMTQRVSEGRS